MGRRPGLLRLLVSLASAAPLAGAAMARSSNGTFAAETGAAAGRARAARFTDAGSGGTVSFGRAAGLLADGGAEGAEWRALVSSVLRDAPFAAFFWEHPPVDRACLGSTPYEFVLVDAGGAFDGMRPEVEAFGEHFRSGEAVSTFENLGGDALLVAPAPAGSPNGAYTHIASFVREADPGQVDQFLRAVGAGLLGRIGEDPLWLSTSGLGVAWLHARMDSRPKYYQFTAYKRWGAR